MLFEKASRMKIRFAYKGQQTVEDLWDLSVEELDIIFKNLNFQLKSTKEESLLQKKTKEDEVVELQVAIVKHIVEVKLQEAEDKKNLRKKLDEKRKIMGILADKQDEALKNLSVEDLQKKLDELDK
jgi:hypothetical protein